MAAESGTGIGNGAAHDREGAPGGPTAEAGTAAAGEATPPLSSVNGRASSAAASAADRSASGLTSPPPGSNREPSAEAKHQIRASILAAAPRVRIAQFSLRESGSAAAMEFALADLDAGACEHVAGAVGALPFVRKVCFV